MIEEITNRFKTVPKADVHNHFHLGGSKKLFLERYNNPTISFPKSYDGLPGMIEFIYNHLNNYLTKDSDVITFMEISIESSIEDRITYLEASVDTNLARFFDGSIQRVIEETQRLVEQHKKQITFKPDIGVNKDLELKKVYEYAEACIDSGVFYGIDLYGKEANQNLTPFIELYKLAKRNGLKTKVHIGEFSDATSIKETILALNPDELQHGISAIYDSYVLDMIRERDIQLNICPESNLLLGAVKNLKSHPIRQLFDVGIRVTINTDDLILFHKTNSEQFQDFYDLGVFSEEELNQIRLNAFA